jgi:cytochrome c oxidase subunit 1
MPRRIYTYDPELGVTGLNQVSTIGALGLGFSVLIFVINFFYSLFRGPVAGRNPWNSNTLEWTAPSPPPHGNFEELPVVRRGPYEYSPPEGEADYIPQTDVHPPLTQPAPAH